MLGEQVCVHAWWTGVCVCVCMCIQVFGRQVSGNQVLKIPFCLSMKQQTKYKTRHDCLFIMSTNLYSIMEL